MHSTKIIVAIAPTVSGDYPSLHSIEICANEARQSALFFFGGGGGEGGILMTALVGDPRIRWPAGSARDPPGPVHLASPHKVPPPAAANLMLSTIRGRINKQRRRGYLRGGGGGGVRDMPPVSVHVFGTGIPRTRIRLRLRQRLLLLYLLLYLLLDQLSNRDRPRCSLFFSNSSAVSPSAARACAQPLLYAWVDSKLLPLFESA